MKLIDHFFCTFFGSVVALYLLNYGARRFKYFCWCLNIPIAIGMLVLCWWFEDDEWKSDGGPYSVYFLVWVGIMLLSLFAIPCSRFLNTPLWTKQWVWKLLLVIHICYWVVIQYVAEEYIMAASGLILILSLPSRKSIAMKGRNRDITWLDLDWAFVLCYTVWHLSNSYTFQWRSYGKSEFFGLSLGLDSVALLFPPEIWLQTRFQTLGIFVTVWLATRKETDLWVSTNTWHTTASERWVQIASVGLAILLVTYHLSRDRYITSLKNNHVAAA